MRKQLFLFTFIFFSIGVFAQEKQPNVLFILADDLGVNALNCYGNGKVHSPNIDRLAAEGVRFTNGYSSAPVCAPARASIMTGQYIPRHKIYRVVDRFKKDKKTLENMKFLPPELNRPTDKQVGLSLEKITIAEALQPEGYATAAFGKWACGTKDLGMGAQGFEESIETTKHYNFKIDPPQSDVLEGEYNADYTTRKGIDFMRKSVAAEQPFFLYMPYYLVHKPLEPKPEYLKYFKEKYKEEFNEETLKVLAMIKSLDESVGQLLAALEDLGIEEETIIIFTSDNGHYKVQDNFFNQPYRDFKGTTYEGGIRVPYIFKWKNKIEAGSVSEEAIINIDLYPTILNLTNSPAPENYILDGEDISPLLLNGSKKTKRTELVWQYANYARYNPKKNTWASKWVNVIQSGAYKMTEDVETGTYHLYDLNKDPYEQNELAGKLPAKIKELTQKLEAWKIETGSETPRLNPAYIGQSLPNEE